MRTKLIWALASVAWLIAIGFSLSALVISGSLLDEKCGKKSSVWPSVADFCQIQVEGTFGPVQQGPSVKAAEGVATPQGNLELPSIPRLKEEKEEASLPVLKDHSEGPVRRRPHADEK